ncbi:hypothetical protein ABGV49_03045 [Chromobacterium vaccinii]|uniref:DUF1566 domain-containing protein n=1 Tax=Chromobacterium vaccinii TaxID=1108595 RepID=A0ABV0FAA1_9NEIS
MTSSIKITEQLDENDLRGFISKANSEQWCGRSDWHLPSLEQLKSLNEKSFLYKDKEWQATLDFNIFDDQKALHESASALGVNGIHPYYWTANYEANALRDAKVERMGYRFAWFGSGGVVADEQRSIRSSGEVDFSVARLVSNAALPESVQSVLNYRLLEAFQDVLVGHEKVDGGGHDYGQVIVDAELNKEEAVTDDLIAASFKRLGEAADRWLGYLNDMKSSLDRLAKILFEGGNGGLGSVVRMDVSDPDKQVGKYEDLLKEWADHTKYRESVIATGPSTLNNYFSYQKSIISYKKWYAEYTALQGKAESAYLIFQSDNLNEDSSPLDIEKARRNRQALIVAMSDLKTFGDRLLQALNANATGGYQDLLLRQNQAAIVDWLKNADQLIEQHSLNDVTENPMSSYVLLDDAGREVKDVSKAACVTFPGDPTHAIWYVGKEVYGQLWNRPWDDTSGVATYNGPLSDLSVRNACGADIWRLPSYVQLAGLMNQSKTNWKFPELFGRVPGQGSRFWTHSDVERKFQAFYYDQPFDKQKTVADMLISKAGYANLLPVSFGLNGSFIEIDLLGKFTYKTHGSAHCFKQRSNGKMWRLYEMNPTQRSSPSKFFDEYERKGNTVDDTDFCFGMETKKWRLPKREELNVLYGNKLSVLSMDVTGLSIRGEQGIYVDRNTLWTVKGDVQSSKSYGSMLLTAD